MSRIFQKSVKSVSRKFQKIVSSVLQECFKEVLFCNFVLACISSQLPKQKEGFLIELHNSGYLIYPWHGGSILFTVFFIVTLLNGLRNTFETSWFFLNTKNKKWHYINLSFCVLPLPLNEVLKYLFKSGCWA